MTALKEVATRLDDIKDLLQELVNNKKSKQLADSPPNFSIMPPQKRVKVGSNYTGSQQVHANTDKFNIN